MKYSIEDCGKIQSDDMEAWYADKADSRYWWVTKQEENANKDIEFLKKYVKEPATVLDVGAGVGTYLGLLSTKMNFSRAVASDISKTALSSVPGFETVEWDIRNPAPESLAQLKPDLLILRETLYYLPTNIWRKGAENVSSIIPVGGLIMSCDSLIRTARRTCWLNMGFELVDRIKYDMIRKDTGERIRGRLFKVDLYRKVK
jgi:hypothetical protein